MNDLLTDSEIAEITGVPARSHNLHERRCEVLKQAGIYFWMKDDGTLATTWTHVHQASHNVSPSIKTLPRFDRAS